MYLVWHGTASIEVVSDGGKILFDPFVPLSGSDIPVSLNDFDDFSDIFVTHGHFDHISDLPKIVSRNPSAKIYCTRTPYSILLKKGVPVENLSLLNYGDVTELSGFRIQALHGKHAILPKASLTRISYMLNSPSWKNIPYILRENRVCVENDETVFYVVEADNRTLFLMGSLNLRSDIQYPTGADLLVLPYNGWDDNFLPAIETIERLKPKRVVLDHYDDTFPPVTWPLDLSPLLKKYSGIVSSMELGKTEEV